MRSLDQTQSCDELQNAKPAQMRLFRDVRGQESRCRGVDETSLIFSFQDRAELNLVDEWLEDQWQAIDHILCASELRNVHLQHLRLLKRGEYQSI